MYHLIFFAQLAVPDNFFPTWQYQLIFFTHPAVPAYLLCLPGSTSFYSLPTWLYQLYHLFFVSYVFLCVYLADQLLMFCLPGRIPANLLPLHHTARLGNLLFLYLAVSADPLSPPTVENLTATGVCLPTREKTLALQMSVMSCVTWHRRRSTGEKSEEKIVG
jgi:hypothetical protein